METFTQGILSYNYLEKIVALSKLKTFLIFLALSLPITFMIFSSMIYIPFYHHDSYKFSVGTGDRNCIHESLLPDPMVRPIHIFLDCLNSKYANSLTKMSHMRFFCITWISILTAFFALWLTTIEMPPLLAFFFSSSLFWLSALQTTLIMGATHLIFAISIAFLSYFTFEKSYQQWSHHLRSKISSLVLLFFATLFLLISLFTYPALSSFFLIPLFLIILFKPISTYPKIKKFALLNILFFSAGNLFYLIVAKYLQHRAYSTQYTNTSDDFALNHDIIGRIAAMSNFYANAWDIHLTTIGFWFFFFILTGGISAGIVKFIKSPFFNLNKIKAINYLLQLLIICSIIAIAGNIVILVSPGGSFIGRIAFTLHCMIAAILFWSLLNICYFFKKTTVTIFVASVFFVSVGVYANYNVTTSALNDNLELNFVVSTIANYMLKHGNNISRIHIIKPTVVNFNGKKIEDDIYDTNSTASVTDELTVANAALLQLLKRGSFVLNNCNAMDGEGMPPAHQKDCVTHNPKNQIALTYARTQDKYYPSPNTIIINMNAIDVLASKEKPRLHLNP